MLKRILLVSPYTKVDAGLMNYGAPALGVHRIADFLLSFNNPKININVDIYDCNRDDLKDFNKLYCKDYDVVGFSVLNETLLDTIELIREFRPLWPSAYFVCGGAEATLNYQELFDNTPINGVVLGEGETTLLELIYFWNREDRQFDSNTYAELKDGFPPGLIHREYNLPMTNGRLFNYYKSLDFSKLGYREFWEKTRELHGGKVPEDIIVNTVRLVSSTHCNRNCIFCSVSQTHRQACGRRVKAAFLGMEHLRKILGRIKIKLPEAEAIYFCEDDFLLDKKRTQDFIESAPPYFKYLIQTHTSKLDYETVRGLAAAGTVHITCGIENCSAFVRQTMNKPQDDQKIEDIVDWCQEFNIRCYYLIILFAPESRIEDLWINYEKLTAWIKKGAVISIEPFMMPYRGAPIFNMLYEFQWRNRMVGDTLLKIPDVILPQDPNVRKIMEIFRERLPGHLRRQRLQDFDVEKAEKKHYSKDHTGNQMVELLGEILEGIRISRE